MNVLTFRKVAVSIYWYRLFLEVLHFKGEEVLCLFAPPPSHINCGIYPYK